jgi:predicted nucleic acid-binding protein
MWWGTPVECQSAVYRRHRNTRLPAELLEQAHQLLATVIANADIVVPALPLRDRAGRLLAVHPLRAGDALQLAAALAWRTDVAGGDTFVCLDGRLRDAARAERFEVLPA